MIVFCPLSPMDISNGKELLRLWADLEDEFNPQIGVCVNLRFDLSIEKDIGEELLAHLRKKFKVYTHVGRRKVEGWPAGCNALELDAYEWFVESNRNQTYDYEYMLIAEADTLPLRKGWAMEIMNEAYDNNAQIMGCMLMRGDINIEHINGNCVMHRDFWKKCRTVFHSPPRVGWDAYIGSHSISCGVASRLIFQEYRLGLPDNPWKGDAYLFEDKFYKSDRNPFYGKPLRPAMIHGVKILDGIRAVRKRVLDGIR